MEGKKLIFKRDYKGLIIEINILKPCIHSAFGEWDAE
jgi:hypothetical protein